MNNPTFTSGSVGYAGVTATKSELGHQATVFTSALTALELGGGTSQGFASATTLGLTGGTTLEFAGATAFGFAGGTTLAFAGGTTLGFAGGTTLGFAGGTASQGGSSSVMVSTTEGLYIGNSNPWKAARDRMAEFGSLQAGWDGYGALPISPQTAENTVTVLVLTSSRLPDPEITPKNGTLTLEWDREDSSATLEIGKTKFSLIIEQLGCQPLFASGRVDQFNANNQYLGPTISNLLSHTQVPSSNTILLGLNSDLPSGVYRRIGENY